MTPLSAIRELRLDFNGAVMPTEWQNGGVDRTTWHELLRWFIRVNELRICAALSEELSRALGLEIGFDPGFLPDLQEIVLELSFETIVGNLFGPFIVSRRVAGRPVRSINMMEGAGSNMTEVSEYTYAWLLNSAIENGGTVVPQRKWTPPYENQRYAHVPLNKPIFFVHNDRENLGLRIVTAAERDCMTLLDVGKPAPVGDASSTFIRINWPGYPGGSSQIMVRDPTPAHNTITVEKFAKRIASAVCKFIDGQSQSRGDEASWRIGPGDITRDQVILLGVVHVSLGSWQPILQLDRHVI
ncbi:hypothetical protein H4582DRAFT_2075566 [Lactarius indigo]|nr:hypothetical protein H4582DRAFT_2075566 [Lactarius indigo]